MGKTRKARLGLVLLLGLNPLNVAYAGEVAIVAANFRTMDNRLWSIQVTLQHADTGWEHYADRWRVVDSKGRVFADRVLYHPHVDEQPFTRGLRALTLPVTTQLYVEAHDNVHGWAKQRLPVRLNLAVKGYLRVSPE